MPNNSNNLDKISSELEQYSFKLSCSEEENKNLKQTLDDNERTLEVLKA